MNAYELADELDKINDIPIETIINMLRQQADRIAELEKQTKPLSDEEIQSIWNEGIVGWYATQEESVLKFARAEERHGIK